MITPMYRFGLVMWVDTKHARFNIPFLCLGDHGAYCRIEYGSE